MEKSTQSDSPFMRRQPVRLGFGTMIMLLLMVVGAGVGLLIFFAMRVPAITTELNAWLGRTSADVDTDAARLAQLKFALFVYTAPLALGMLVYFLHFLINWIDRWAKRQETPDREEFRMD